MTATARQVWTYESLAATDRRTLESVLMASAPPDPDELEGFVYCGWNHEPIPQRLSGEKFRKGFRRRDGRPFGFNELVEQDHKGPAGEWNPVMEDGRSKQLGFFRVGLVADEKPNRLNRKYAHAGHLNYDVARNTWLNLPFRVIRDFSVLPNPGDHDLVLCKAYFQLLIPQLTIFYCFFLLGHRRPIEFEPEWAR
jgi:hypothetical protein